MPTNTVIDVACLPMRVVSTGDDCDIEKPVVVLTGGFVVTGSGP